MDNNDLKNEFLVESFENLSSIHEDLTTIEREPENKDLLNQIYRGVHTMKGSASFLGFKKLQDITHIAEFLLDEVREGKFSINAVIIDALLDTFDICQSILKSIEENDAEGDVDITSNIKILEKLTEQNGCLEIPNSAIQNETSVDVEAETSIAKNNPVETNSVNSNVDEVTIVPEEEPEDEAEGGISAAALASLQELISDGKVDADIMSEFSSEGQEQEVEEKILVEPVAAESQDATSDAIDSLRLLVSGDPSEEEKSPEESSPPEALAKVEEPVESKVITPPKVVEAPKDLAPKKSIADSIVRVNVKVLDRIMNIVGELVLNRNQILQFASIRSDSDLTRLSQQLNVITSELQSEVMSTRMQPVGSILTKFERLVRDFSRENGKQIVLKLFGQDTELDKTLIEAIKDPLVHIIRNACDHGIEKEHERELKGKNPQGSITIKSYNESGQVTIEIVDDGKGLDKNMIGRKAIEKGMVTEEQLVHMPEGQIFSLIFEPGFSTADKITNISGRGVGMDVVKTNIEKIGGSVAITSEIGVGTTFKLRIPLTLAIVPALIIKSAFESFAIPQLNLVELVRLETADDKKLIEKIQGSEFLRLRGELTPVFRLDDELGLKEVHSKAADLAKVLEQDQIGMSSSAIKGEVIKEKHLDDEEDIATNVIILNAEDRFYGVVVDEILDTEEIVVKPLNKQLKKLALFGGATIMGDGHVALILDALGFLSSVQKNDNLTKEAHALEHKAVDNSDSVENQENLLFKLADGRTYAVPLSLVSRLEEISSAKVEMTGSQPIIRYLNSPMPLINVEETLQLEGESKLKKLDDEEIVLPCIVTNVMGKNYGIIVEEIQDISIDSVTIDDTAVDREGILGTIFVNDKTVSLVDLFGIISAQKLGSGKVDPEHTPTLSSKKILIADDSPMYRKMEKDLLTSCGFYVEAARTGEEAIEKLRSSRFDLLITDIEMPKLNGYDLCKQIRKDEQLKSVPVLAISTLVGEADIAKGKESGFDYHLEKFDKEEVIKVINTIFKEVI